MHKMISLTSFIFSLLVTTTLSAPAAITKRQYTSDTYNQLTDGTPCRNISLIYARGLNEAGNIGGPADLGPLFLNEVATKVGGEDKIAVQGINYAASYFGLLIGGDPFGSIAMARVITRVSVAKYVFEITFEY